MRSFERSLTHVLQIHVHTVEDGNSGHWSELSLADFRFHFQMSTYIKLSAVWTH